MSSLSVRFWVICKAPSLVCYLPALLAVFLRNPVPVVEPMVPGEKLKNFWNFGVALSFADNCALRWNQKQSFYAASIPAPPEPWVFAPFFVQVSSAGLRCLLRVSTSWSEYHIIVIVYSDTPVPLKRKGRWVALDSVHKYWGGFLPKCSETRSISRICFSSSWHWHGPASELVNAKPLWIITHDLWSRKYIILLSFIIVFLKQDTMKSHSAFGEECSASHRVSEGC